MITSARAVSYIPLIVIIIKRVEYPFHCSCIRMYVMRKGKVIYIYKFVWQDSIKMQNDSCSPEQRTLSHTT